MMCWWIMLFFTTFTIVVSVSVARRTLARPSVIIARYSGTQCASENLKLPVSGLSTIRPQCKSASNANRKKNLVPEESQGTKLSASFGSRLPERVP